MLSKETKQILVLVLFSFTTRTSQDEEEIEASGGRFFVKERSVVLDL
jgi:hypothetical protein